MKLRPVEADHCSQAPGRRSGDGYQGHGCPSVEKHNVFVGFLNSKGLRPLPPTPRKQSAFEFKFTVKLRLEFDLDFDLISGSNFNKMGIKVVQISTYHFQI